MLSVALIGFGSSGGRFLRALIYRQRFVGDVVLKAVCDSNVDRLKIFSGQEIKKFNNVDDLLIDDNYDVIIVATNENSHFDVLRKIHKYQHKFKRLLVEKLLVETINQAEMVSEIFSDTDISVHFVERHSLIVERLMIWMKMKNLQVNRATFFWGKNRLNDHRPTIGVISEISHPIDLILMISRIESDTDFKILGGSYIYSDFSVSGKQVLDTINVNLKFGENLIVNGSSSFLWDKRMRKIQLFLTDSTGIVKYIANITFDNPNWDIDECCIKKINETDGSSSVIEQWKIEQEDLEEELLCVVKTNKYIEENIEEIKNGKKSMSLARLSQARYVQKIIHEIKKDSMKNIIETPIFGGLMQNLGKYGECDELLYNLLEGKNDGKEFIKFDKS